MSVNPINSSNVSLVSTEPLKSETPKENPKTPLPKENFKGKTVFEAITMQAKADGTIQAGDTPKIDKLVGRFSKEGENIIADHYMEGDKKLFKFDVKWEAKVNGKSVEFTQVIYTSIEIPDDGSKLQDASKQAYEVAKSYELLQRNLKQTGSSPEIRAIQQSALISFEKKVAQLDLGNYKTSYLPKTSSGDLDVKLLKFERTPTKTAAFGTRLEKMQAQKIKFLLTEGSSSVKAECDRKDAGLPAKVDPKEYKAHLDGKLKEVKKESKAALAPSKVANSDAIAIKQQHKELRDLQSKKPGEIKLVEAAIKDFEEKFDAIPELKALQDEKKNFDNLSKLYADASIGPKAEDFTIEIEECKAKSKEIEEKIISMKSDILNNPIKAEEEERFELKLEGEVDNGPELDEISGSEDSDSIGDRDDPFKNWHDVGTDSVVSISGDKELKELNEWKVVAKNVLKEYQDLFSKNDKIVELKQQIVKFDKRINAYYDDNLSMEENEIDQEILDIKNLRTKLKEQYEDEVSEITIPKSYSEFLISSSVGEASKDPEFVQLLEEIDSYLPFYPYRSF